MCAKGVIFGGFYRQKGGQKGRSWGSKAGKKGTFLRVEGINAGSEGIFGIKSDTMTENSSARNHPERTATGATDATLLRHGSQQVVKHKTRLVSRLGLEPRTLALKGQCSTD